MDLLFAPWPPRAAVPADWVLQTVAPVWQAWAPETAAAQVAQLRSEIGDGDVALLPLF
jgi:hypothetical protein